MISQAYAYLSTTWEKRDEFDEKLLAPINQKQDSAKRARLAKLRALGVA